MLWLLLTTIQKLCVEPDVRVCLRIGHLHVRALPGEFPAGRLESTILNDDLSRDEGLSRVVHSVGNSTFVRDVMPSPSTVSHILNS